MINEQRLVRTFLELVAIDSPSGHEQVIGEELMSRFAALGGQGVRDEHGNLIVRWPDGAGEWLMLSAHMDTVGTDVGIKPQTRDGVIYSDGTTILGADDKSGVAIILEVLQSLREDGANIPRLEVVISVGEEVMLRGARLLDKGKLRSRQGYVLDAGGPIGTIVVSAPSQNSFDIVIHGRTAHAGSEPERGVNAIRVASEAIAAMPLGRIDPETTANIGIIEGGTARNIVPDRVHIVGEARSRNEASLQKQTDAMARALEDAAGRHGARVEIDLQSSYRTYRLSETTPVVARAVAAARHLDLSPLFAESGGGADANIYAASGIVCAVISTGMAEVHTPKEHIAIADMVQSARWLEEIVKAA